MTNIKPYKMLIDGKWVDSICGETIFVFSPSTGENIATIPFAKDEDVDNAVKAAHRAFPGWKKTQPHQRRDILHRVSVLLNNKVQDLAYLAACDNGSPIKHLRGYITRAAEWLNYFGCLITELKGQTVPTSDNIFAYTIRQPYGVIAEIIPWNAPLVIFVSHVAPAIAAGNTVVIKISELAPLAELELAKLMNELLPPGVLNVITGLGTPTGESLVKHPLVQKVSFTGATSTGKEVIKMAADNVTPVTMELGGNNPAIVFPDADIEKAVQGVISGMCLHLQGQSCYACTRLFLHKKPYDSFMDFLINKLKSVVIGLPTDDQTDMGALISEKRLQSVFKYIEDGLSEGSCLITGGKSPEEETLSNGNYLLPTIISEVESDMKITQESSFGPVLLVQRWDNYDEMLCKVNDVPQGLSAAVWTRDITLAHTTVRQLKARYVWINQAARIYTGVPFGGMGTSGFGKQICLENLLSYTQEMSIMVKL